MPVTAIGSFANIDEEFFYTKDEEIYTYSIIPCLMPCAILKVVILLPIERMENEEEVTLCMMSLMG